RTAISAFRRRDTGRPSPRCSCMKLLMDRLSGRNADDLGRAMQLGAKLTPGEAIRFAILQRLQETAFLRIHSDRISIHGGLLNLATSTLGCSRRHALRNDVGPFTLRYSAETSNEVKGENTMRFRIIAIVAVVAFSTLQAAIVQSENGPHTRARAEAK